jgi:CRISPR type III-B/RAMP module-associated protein Cmr5
MMPIQPYQSILLKDKRVDFSANRQSYHATQVYGCIDAILQLNNESLKSKFATLCHDLPFLFRRNGLLASLEWMHTKFDPNKPDDNIVYEYMLANLFWCLRHLTGDNLLDEALVKLEWSKQLLANVKAANLTEYMLYTNHCVEISEWFRLIAQSKLGKPNA